MARFETAEAADALCEYLNCYLPVGEREYDQEWAIGALAWINYRMGSDRARVFARDPHLWKITTGGRQIGSLDPHGGVDQMGEIMGFLEDYGLCDRSA